MDAVQEFVRYSSIVIFLMPLLAMFTGHIVGYIVSFVWGAVAWIILVGGLTQFTFPGSK